MQVWLYKRTQDKKYISPSLGNHKELTDVVFKEAGSLDIIRPHLKAKISTVDVINDFNGYNYMYIPQLKSYYWITWHTEGALIYIDGERDALKTFWRDIKRSTQYVTRAESPRNKYIVDNQLPIHSQHNYLIKNITNGAHPVYLKNCNSVLLETIGKGGTPT